MIFGILFIALIIFSVILLKKHFKKVREKTEENKAKAAELDPTGKKFDKKHKAAAYIGIGVVALIPIIMIFGFCSTKSSGGKWEFSKTTENGLGKWYIKFTDDMDAIFRLDVQGEVSNYFIGMDFFVEDKYTGSGWSKVSDSSDMGINNFNDNLEVLLTKYPLIGEYKGKWVVIYNGVDLTELKKKNMADFCWGEMNDGKIKAKIKYSDLDKYLK